MGETPVDLDQLWDACKRETWRIFGEHYDETRDSLNMEEQPVIEVMLNSKKFQNVLKAMKDVVKCHPQAGSGYRDMEKLRAMYKCLIERKEWEKREDEVFTLLYLMAKGFIGSNPYPRYSPAVRMWIYSVMLHESFARHLAGRYVKGMYDCLIATGEIDMILPTVRDQLPRYLKGTTTHLLESLSHRDRLLGRRVYTMMRQENIGYGASFRPYNEKITH